MESNETEEFAPGINAPFADLYLDMFPEFYDVE